MDGAKDFLQAPTSLELCAGAGGQALGLEAAGFRHIGLCEIDAHARETLKLNRPNWRVFEGAQADIKTFDGTEFQGVDLLAGGLPCPPFSKAGRQLGEQDERNLFADFIRVTKQCTPSAILIENVRGFLDPTFDSFRQNLRSEFQTLGYDVNWRLLHSSDFGVPQLRPRVVIVGFKKDITPHFTWPEPCEQHTPTVGDVLVEEMASRGWKGARSWAKGAQKIAPTLVGGSKKHGGPDLGPTRARKAWAELGVEGRTLAEEPPDPGFVGMPRLTVKMAARLQGFPPEWEFYGKKTPAYRQVGNAFPPAVAQAVGSSIANALSGAKVSFAGSP